MPEDSLEVKEFISRFESELQEYSKSTARSYGILREFFEEEVSKVASNIKNFDSFANEVKSSMKESKIDELEEIIKIIESIKAKITRKKEIFEEMGKKDDLAEEFKKEKSRLLREVHNLENGNDYKDFNLLKQKLELLRKQNSEKEAEITSMFSALEKPMKKYARISFNDKDLLERYADTPVMALTQDFALKIIGVLDNLSKAIQDNTIELKDKQKPKALNEISRLDKPFLSKFVSGYAQLKKKENMLVKEINHLEVLKKLKESREKLKITSAMFDKAKKDLETFGEEIGKIDIEKMKKDFVSKVKELLNINLVIS